MSSFGRRPGLNYVHRGDLSSFDFGLPSFTTDGAWHDLDLSSIFPFVNVLVRMRLLIYDNAIDSYLFLREKRKSNLINLIRLRTQVSGIQAEDDVYITCDGTGKIEYIATDTTFSSIGLVVIGWFL